MPEISGSLITGQTRANQIDESVMALATGILQFLASSPGLSTDVVIKAALASVATVGSNKYFDELRVVGPDAKNGYRIHNSTGDFQVRIRAEADWSGGGVTGDAIVIEYADGATAGDMDTEPTYTEWMAITSGTIWHSGLGDLSGLGGDGGGLTNLTVSPDYGGGLAASVNNGVGVITSPAPGVLGSIPYAADANGNWTYAYPSVSGVSPIWNASTGQWVMTAPSLFAHGKFSGSNETAHQYTTSTESSLVLASSANLRGGMSLSSGYSIDIPTDGTYLIQALMQIRTANSQAGAESTQYRVAFKVKVGGSVVVQNYARPEGVYVTGLGDLSSLGGPADGIGYLVNDQCWTSIPITWVQSIDANENVTLHAQAIGGDVSLRASYWTCNIVMLSTDTE